MITSEFKPNWACAPGDTIIDIIREQNLSDEEFAHRIELPDEDLRDLLQGRAIITLAIARKLKLVLGASIEFWMTRDYQYRQDIANLNVSDEKWLSEFPIEDMVKFGWIPKTSNSSETINACLHFFDVPDIRTWNKVYMGVLQNVVFKKSQTFESRPSSVATWIRQGEIEARKIDSKPWTRSGFKGSLQQIIKLTRIKNPLKFIPDLINICSENGVALVILRTPQGCPSSGATKFISPDKAMILLSFRYLTDDHFWFAFFHEVGHLLQHGANNLFIEGAGIPLTSEEEEADDFAENVLIPAKFRQDLFNLSANTYEVIKFAMKVGISPGIVVGQLQHLGIIPYSHLNKLKRHYIWKE